MIAGRDVRELEVAPNVVAVLLQKLQQNRNDGIQMGE
jgi:hypothetical protein